MMPNWLSGSLKLRGKSTDILRFFNEGVNCYKSSVNKNSDRVYKLIDKAKCMQFRHDEDENYTEISFSSSFSEPYIEETKRAFIDLDLMNDNIIVHDGEIETAICGVKQAWDFKTEDWVNISKTYNLDLKLFGIDSSWGFMHEIEIIEGKVMVDEPHKFSDYNDFKWNCPFPWIGG